MSSSTIAWKPSLGRHQVNIGPSLGRAIKARKLKGSPAPNTKRSNLPERDFYSFRYNFKPGAFDSTRPATIEIKKGEENTQVFAEFPSKELNEVCTYNGFEQPAKDVDCILIYDEDTGQFTLEKLDSFVLLKHIGKKAVAPSAPSPSIPTSKRKRDDDDDELERLLLAGGADRETDTVHQSQKYRKEEEEEGDEGDDADIPLRVQMSHRPSATLPAPIANGSSRLMPQSKSRDSNPTHVSNLPSNFPSASISIPTIPLLAPTPSKPKLASTKPTKRTKTAAAPAIPISTTPMTLNASSMAYADKEVLDVVKPFRKPQAATSTSRKPAPVPPDPPKPKPPLELSLPGKQSGFVPPPAPIDSSSATRISPTTSTNSITDPPGVSATITMEEVLGEEEEEEDWEPVTAATSTSVAATSQQHDYDLQLERDIFGEGFGEEADADAEEVEGEAEEEEIDVNAFEAELNDFFGDDGEGDEDEDMEDAMQEVAGGDNSRHPISLNKLASGMAEGVDSEDDFSSSESESD